MSLENEAGLAMEVLWLDETVYPAAGDRTSIGTLQWVQYCLDSFRSVADVVADVEALGDRYEQDVFVSSNADIRDLSLSIFDRTFIVTNILYWLAVGVAIVGILGSMLALQLERGRELGLLRALGMTPRQVGSMITAQTGVIGLLSGLAAIPLGVVMAYVLIKVINRRAFGWQIDMTVTADILAVSVVFAIGAALLAGLYPAWRAGRVVPVESIKLV